jgi:hypothetical protein
MTDQRHGIESTGGTELDHRFVQPYRRPPVPKGRGTLPICEDTIVT